jgi:hypothetical protein
MRIGLAWQVRRLDAILHSGERLSIELDRERRAGCSASGATDKRMSRQDLQNILITSLSHSVTACRRVSAVTYDRDYFLPAGEDSE